MSRHVFDTVCPWCQMRNEVNRGLSDDSEPPSEGDVSFCYECLLPSIYAAKWNTLDGTSGMLLRRPDDAELEEIKRMPTYEKVVLFMATDRTPCDHCYRRMQPDSNGFWVWVKDGTSDCIASERGHEVAGRSSRG